MTVSMAALWRLFLYSFLLGITIGLFYTLFHMAKAFLLAGDRTPGEPRRPLPAAVMALWGAKRKSKRIKGASFFIVFSGELLFCLLTSLCFILFFYCFNDGIPRLFVLPSAALGFFAFRRSLGRLLYRFTDAILSFLYILFLFFKAYVLLPTEKAAKAIFSVLYAVLRQVFSRVKKVFLDVYHRILMKQYIKKELKFLQHPSFLQELSE